LTVRFVGRNTPLPLRWLLSYGFIIAAASVCSWANWSTQPGWSGAVENGADPCASAGVHCELPDSDVSPRSIPMLGPPKPRRLDKSVAVSLEDLVPPDHFYHHAIF
jgi:hypothetical protein